VAARAAGARILHHSRPMLKCGNMAQIPAQVPVTDHWQGCFSHGQNLPASGRSR
jgi:hypothetical protein